MSDQEAEAQLPSPSVTPVAQIPVNLPLSATSISVVERILCNCMTCEVPMVSSVLPMGVVVRLSVSAKNMSGPCLY